ncbi:MAG: hypothetical protein ACOC5T_06050 [Elusimicrobiota bacterium]
MEEAENVAAVMEQEKLSVSYKIIPVHDVMDPGHALLVGGQVSCRLILHPLQESKLGIRIIQIKISTIWRYNK